MRDAAEEDMRNGYWSTDGKKRKRNGGSEIEREEKRERVKSHSVSG